MKLPFGITWAQAGKVALTVGLAVASGYGGSKVEKATTAAAPPVPPEYVINLHYDRVIINTPPSKFLLNPIYEKEKE